MYKRLTLYTKIEVDVSSTISELIKRGTKRKLQVVLVCVLLFENSDIMQLGTDTCFRGMFEVQIT